MGKHRLIGLAIEHAGCAVLEQLLDRGKQLHEQARGRQITSNAAVDQLLEGRLELSHALAPSLLGDHDRLIEHREQRGGEVAPPTWPPAGIARFALLKARGDGRFAIPYFVVTLSHAAPRLPGARRAPAPRAVQSSRRWRAGVHTRRYAPASGELPHRHTAGRARAHNTPAPRARRQ